MRSAQCSSQLRPGARCPRVSRQHPVLLGRRDLALSQRSHTLAPSWSRKVLAPSQRPCGRPVPSRHHGTLGTLAALASSSWRPHDALAVVPCPRAITAPSGPSRPSRRLRGALTTPSRPSRALAAPLRPKQSDKLRLATQNHVAKQALVETAWQDNPLKHQPPHEKLDSRLPLWRSSRNAKGQGGYCWKNSSSHLNLGPAGQQTHVQVQGILLCS